MKRLLVIPIMFLYLVAVSGVLIHTHYCGKQLESWQVYVKSDEGCKDDVCSDIPDMEKGCCKDKVVVAKVNTDQTLVSFFKLQVAPALLPKQPLYITTQHIVALVSQKSVKHRPNAPPGRWQNIPLYKLHSKFKYFV
jgi:hypothetical protein